MCGGESFVKIKNTFDNSTFIRVSNKTRHGITSYQKATICVGIH
jgi:hypothetical protein